MLNPTTTNLTTNPLFPQLPPSTSRQAQILLWTPTLVDQYFYSSLYPLIKTLHSILRRYPDCPSPTSICVHPSASPPSRGDEKLGGQAYQRLAALQTPSHTCMKMRNSELSGSTYISRPRSLTIIRPSYRVLYVIRVEPEVVTSSVDGGEDHRTFDSEGSEDDTGQDHGADQAAEAAVPAPSTTPDPDPNPAPARASPPLVFTHIPQSPRIEAMLRRPIHRPRPEYRFTGPDFYILRESFMRTYSPHWRPPHGEPARQPESHMYTTMNDGQGPVSYSNRLAQWLDELPDAGEGRMEAMQSPSPQPPEAQPHVHAEKSCQHDGQSCGRAESSRPNEDQLPGPSRARCNSAPVPSAISNNHLMGTLDHRTAPQNVIMPFSAASPVADLRGGSAIPSLHHPNPLGHHPILSQELPIQLRIPKRRSSLRNITRGSQSNQVPAASISRAAPEDLVPDIESFHIDRPTAFGATQINTGHQKSLSYLQTDSKGNKSRDPADYHRLSTHIHQLFGKDSREPNSKKHARTEVRIPMTPCYQSCKPFTGRS